MTIDHVAHQAKKKLGKLVRIHSFRNIVLDDWRGYRFIYDSDEVRACENDCKNCRLYNLLVDEPVIEGGFNAGLYLASDTDKKLFGDQRFLNCKTLKQYGECFINFIVKVAETDETIEQELTLVKNARLMYTSTDDAEKKDAEFKRYVCQESLRRAPNEKKIKIKKALEKLFPKQDFEGEII